MRPITDDWKPFVTSVCDEWMSEAGARKLKATRQADINAQHVPVRPSLDATPVLPETIAVVIINGALLFWRAAGVLDGAPEVSLLGREVIEHMELSDEDRERHNTRIGTATERCLRELGYYEAGPHGKRRRWDASRPQFVIFRRSITTWFEHTTESAGEAGLSYGKSDQLDIAARYYRRDKVARYEGA